MTDHSDPDNHLIKPRSVGLAERLMYAGAAVAIIEGLIRRVLREQVGTALDRKLGDGQQARDAVEHTSQMGLGAIVVGLFTAAVWVLVARVVASGHRVGRPIATTLGVLGAFWSSTTLTNAYYWPLTAVYIANAVLAATIVVLLWRPDASRFFRAHRVAARDDRDADGH